MERVKDYIEVKVRLRDPLDDNAAHLIPSSRIITARNNNAVPSSSLNRCQPSARLDRAFVQGGPSTARTFASNLNMMPSGRGTGRNLIRSQHRA